MRDIGEARIEMSDVSSTPLKPDEPIADGRRSKSPLWMALGAAAATLLTWGFLQVRAPSPPGVARATITLPVGKSQRRLLNASIAISPDGSLLAYAAEDADGSALFLRPLDRFETRRLPGTEGADMPFFSPDGRWVGFFAAGQLKKASVDRGSAVTITRAPSGFGASWGADDTIVYAPTVNAGLFRVSADGGEPEQLTKPGFDETGYAHVWPHHLPGARAVLFTVWGGNNGSATLNLESGEWRRILEGLEQNVFGSLVGAPQYLPTGHLLFADPGRGAGLFAVPFDPEELTVTGATTSVIDDVRFLDAESAWPFATVSQTGTIVYIAARAEPTVLAWMDRGGGLSPIIHRDGGLEKPRLSPNGKMVLFQDAQGNIAILDMERGTTAVVADQVVLEGDAFGHVWSPDGRRFAFSSNRAGSFDLYEKTVSERGEPETLLIRGLDQFPSSWSPDGQLLLFSEDHPVSGADLWLLPVGKEPIPLLVTQYNEKWAKFSPDGRFLAYVSDESGRYQVYVRSYPEGETFLVSIDGGEEPAWSRDGRELFFRHGNAFLVVDVTTEPGFRTSAPRVLHESSFDRSNYGGETYYDVSPDEQRFLVVADRSTTEFQVVFNWFEELKRLAPTEN